MKFEFNKIVIEFDNPLSKEDQETLLKFVNLYHKIEDKDKLEKISKLLRNGNSQ